MLSKEEYQKNLRRMFDSLRAEHKGEDNCAGVKCTECPFKELSCSLGASNFYLFETMEIVENWSKEHPVVTNTMKFEEIFGVQPSEISSCDDFWNSPYREQESFINKPCISSDACHEDKIKVLDKITTEIEQLTVTVDANRNQTVVTIKLSDLNDIIHGYVSKNDVINIINKYKTER